MPTRAHCMAVARDPSSGAVLTSATVQVYSPGTTAQIAATIYDKNGNVLSNPLTSDATTGLIDFYLNVSQEVDLVVSKNGFTTRTYSNVPVLDDASYELTALLTTTGDIAYASSANTPARLAMGSAGQLLIYNGGVPGWSGTITNNTATTFLANINGNYVRFNQAAGLAGGGTQTQLDPVQAAATAFVFIQDGGGGWTVAHLNGSAHSVTFVVQGTYSVLGNASTNNVGWNGSAYVLQNNTAGAENFVWMIVGNG